MFTPEDYEEAERAYERSLPPEHYMEATGQSTQRKITLESLDFVHAQRPEVQVFSELLVLYPHGRGARIHGVVPDNMVVLWKEPIEARGSYQLPFQPCGPFWVLEYVSESNKRKDYEDNLRRYERHLKVPYYLLFHPEEHDLKLYRHMGKAYRGVRPTGEGRFPIKKLDLEVGLLDAWVRFWYQGQLLPLPADLLRELNETRRQLAEMTRRVEAAEEELARLRAQLGRTQ